MTRYEQGFMNKCAEYGVDGHELLKTAQLSGRGVLKLLINLNSRSPLGMSRIESRANKAIKSLSSSGKLSNRTKLNLQQIADMSSAALNVESELKGLRDNTAGKLMDHVIKGVKTPASVMDASSHRLIFTPEVEAIVNKLRNVAAGNDDRKAQIARVLAGKIGLTGV